MEQMGYWLFHSSFDDYNIMYMCTAWCIYVSVILSIAGSDNGLTPAWCKAIVWTNDDVWSVGPLRTHFSEIWIKIQQFTSMEMKPTMSCENDSHFVQAAMI